MEAAKWYRKLAESGYSVAQYQLGCMHEQGVGVVQNLEDAVKWYRKAAEKGNEDAKAALKRLGIEYIDKIIQFFKSK